MKVVLCHKTALEYWDMAGTGTLASSQVTTLADCAYRSGDLESFHMSRLHLTPPYHVLVDSPDKRRNLDGWCFHLRIERLPRRSLFHIGNNVYVVSPELAFCQVARGMGVVQAIALGMELCGTYSTRINDPFDDFEEHLIQRPPITSSARIAAFVKRDDGVSIKHPARIAAQWIADDSASPAETIGYLRMCLPYRYGGYGLPRPVLNRKVGLSTRAMRMTHRQFLRCDYFWPDKRLGIEYNSREYHSGEMKHEDDEVRRDVLEFKGITVLVLLKRHLYEPRGFDDYAVELARFLGKRLRLPADHERLRRELHLALAGGERFGWEKV